MNKLKKSHTRRAAANRHGAVACGNKKSVSRDTVSDKTNQTKRKKQVHVDDLIREYRSHHPLCKVGAV